VAFYLLLLGLNLRANSFDFMNTAKEHTLNVAMVFVKRIMWDVDNNEDLKFLLEQKEKPEIAEKIRKILDSK